MSKPLKDTISLLAAQHAWAARGLYPAHIDGRWGPSSAAADRKLPWLKAAQTFWKELGWYREEVDGFWGDESEKAHRAHAHALNTAPADETNAEQWAAMKVSDPSRFEWAVAGAKKNQARYIGLEVATNVPWWFIACIHCRECSYDFNQHLHNGDPLTDRTVHVPAGRPKVGHPRFTWEESARDALGYEGFTGLTDWSVPVALDRLERYNGLGYQKRALPSPYLWAGTDQYLAGKYIADGVFSATYVDRQPGCAGMIKLLGAA